MYVAGLYLESPSKDSDAILASDRAKAIRMHFLRDLTKPQLVDALREGFEANAPDKTGQRAEFNKMLALITDVKEGDSLTFAYLPEGNTTLQIGSKKMGGIRMKGLRRRRLFNLAGVKTTLRGLEERHARHVNG